MTNVTRISRFIAASLFYILAFLAAESQCLGQGKQPGTVITDITRLVPRKTLSVPYEVRSLAISSDGERIAAACYGEIHIWTAQGEEVAVLKVGEHVEGGVGSPKQSPNSSPGEPGMRPENPTSKPLNPSNSLAEIVARMAFSTDNANLIALMQDYSVKVWSVKDGKLLRELIIPEKRTLCFALSPDGKTLATGGRDHHIYFWDVESGQLRITCEAQSFEVRQLAFNENDILVSVGVFSRVAPKNAIIAWWNAKTGAMNAYISCDKVDPNSVIISAQGNFIASVWEDWGKYVVQVWDTHGGRPIFKIDNQWTKLTRLAFSTDERYLLVVGTFDVRLPRPKEFRFIEFTMRGLRIWDFATGEELGWAHDYNILPGYDLATRAKDASLFGAMSDQVVLSYRNTIKFWNLP